MENLITTNGISASLNEERFNTLKDLCKDFLTELEDIKTSQKDETILKHCWNKQQELMIIFKDLCAQVKPHQNHVKSGEKLKIRDLKKEFTKIISDFAATRKAIKAGLKRPEPSEKITVETLDYNPYTAESQLVGLYLMCFLLWIDRFFVYLISKDEIDRKLSDIALDFGFLDTQTLLKGENVSELKKLLESHSDYIMLLPENQQVTEDQLKKRKELAEQMSLLRTRFQQFEIA